MTRLEERIRSGLQETAERVPDTAPTSATRRLRSNRPTGVWVGVVAVAAVLVLFTPILLRDGFDPGTTPAGDPGPFLGTWVTTSGIFGSSATMVIEASEDASVEILVDDTPMCSDGTPSTIIGTGRLEGDNQLVIPAPVLTCDDGSQPETLSGPPLEEELQNLTFTHDPGTDILTDKPGSVWTREGAEPSMAVTELLNGFLEARVAGEGAEEYLNVPEEDIPLLYATSSGAPYERAEFERERGIEWPYGWMAFRVRLFAGDTVVEQLVFWRPGGRLGLDYDPDGFGTHIPPTTEDGQPLAVPHNLFGGEVTLHTAHPWIFVDYAFVPLGRLIPEGPDVLPTTDGGQRIDWDEFWVMADPAVEGTGCQTASPADAQALAESIRSYRGLEATAPATVSAGGTEALMMDVVIAAGATIRVAVNEQYNLCANGLLNPILDQGVGSSMTVVNEGVMRGQATGERMRLYLFDMPEGSSIRTTAIAIVAPETRFERAVEAAAPVVDSVEFHTP